mmetsp:Transcript_86876/g.243402  ORF Transcript_86876/g.243402 Transcript_86876/m.243402 type:complete len:274 (+) Transcript_86876:820-1641(+)
MVCRSATSSVPRAAWMLSKSSCCAAAPDADAGGIPEEDEAPDCAKALLTPPTAPLPWVLLRRLPMRSASAKICASSWPSSRESTIMSGVAYNGVGKHTASLQWAKFWRKRQRWSASVCMLVCICTCSQNSSAALLIPSIRRRRLLSAISPKRRSHARSASRSSFTPGRRHFTAISVPSWRTPKKTSAMLPLACGRKSRDWSCSFASARVACTRSRETSGAHGAVTCWCMLLNAWQTASGNRSRRVASHCESFTKHGPQLSRRAATICQKETGS